MKLLLLFIKPMRFVYLLFFITSFSNIPSNTNKTSHHNVLLRNNILTDAILQDSSIITYTPYKEHVHASYYHDKFNGRKTASGEKFDNNLYTAAHKTLPFGTKIKVTNAITNQSIIVTVNDRGPFVKSREIDLSKKAFMAITNHKLTGFLIVDLEILEEQLVSY